jgi:hypothetical protein
MSKSSRSQRRQKRPQDFVRLPMFDEIQKLVASQKIVESANADTVGWEKISMFRDPATGLYLGSPQHQAAKSRQHLTSAKNMANRDVTARLSDCCSRAESNRCHRLL